MFSEVYHSMLVRTIVVLGRACKSCETTPTALWYGCHVVQREKGPRHFGPKLNSEDDSERSRRGLPKDTPETHLHVGEGPGLSTELPN